MENYINGLIQDIEHKILMRWNECTPHHYCEDHVLDAVEKPPENWIKPQPISPEIKTKLHFQELDKWECGEGEMSMYQILDILPEAFPSADKLSNAQLNKLLFSTCRLWAAHNFYPDPPTGFPNRELYTLMRAYMHEPNQLQNQSASVINFCGYYPPECPFGAYCQCNIDDEDEDLSELDQFFPLLDQKNVAN